MVTLKRGFKIDFTNAGENSGLSTGDLYPQLIGDGSSWETYTFPIEIPAEVDGLKIVPLWGPNSSIAYDNFCFDPNPLESPLNPPTEPPVDPPTPPSTAAQLSEGTLISWQPDQAERIYQPQSSQDGSTWTDLGPAFPGTETTSILDPNSAPFHRVQEREPLGEQFIINGDFENADPNNPSCPRNWSCLSTSGQFPRRVEGRAFSGSASVSIAVQNDEGGAPNQSEIQQNLLAAGGFIIGGDTYTFSFRAMQLSAGESYVQMYRLQWLDINGAPINGADVGFNSFEGGNGFWNEIIEPSLVAPPSANGVFIQIFGATGVSSNLEARGEVLIDAIRLTPGSPSTPINLATTSEPGIGITQLTRIGVRYRAQQSEDLDHFTDLSLALTNPASSPAANFPSP